MLGQLDMPNRTMRPDAGIDLRVTPDAGIDQTAVTVSRNMIRPKTMDVSFLLGLDERHRHGEKQHSQENRRRAGLLLENKHARRSLGATRHLNCDTFWEKIVCRCLIKLSGLGSPP